MIRAWCRSEGTYFLPNFIVSSPSRKQYLGKKTSAGGRDSGCRTVWLSGNKAS